LFQKEILIFYGIDSRNIPNMIVTKAAWILFKETVATITADQLPQTAKDKLLELTKYFVE